MDSNLPLNKLDISGIKESLKEHFKKQEKFSDFDFEGSTMSGILDLLAHNTYMNGFYLNMAANESFISTAVKRESVVERAKTLGYKPYSAKCATGLIDIVIKPSSVVPQVSLPRGSIFLAAFDDGDFLFRTKESVNVLPNINGEYVANNIELIEGKYLIHEFIIDTSTLSGVILPNQNIDMDLLEVTVKSNGNLVPTTYTLSKGMSTEQNIYYTEEVDGGLYKIYMGDDIFGKKLSIGDTITVSYFISSGKSPNGIGSYTLKSSIDNIDTMDIFVHQTATGGSDVEDISSIKFNAVNNFSKRDRLITPKDFEGEISQIYPRADDVISYGGEKLDPPIYGSVFIAIRPNDGYVLTDVEKTKIQNLLNEKNISVVTPVVVDPDYSFIKIISTIHYDLSKTNTTVSLLKEEVTASILVYNKENLNSFGKETETKGLRRSVISTKIDNTSKAVINNNISYKVSKRIEPQLKTNTTLEINFGVAIKKNTVVSTKFDMLGLPNCYFVESLSNADTMDIVRDVSGTRTIIIPKAATIDYSNGNISSSILLFDSLSNEPSLYDSLLHRYFMKFEGEPSNEDIIPKNNQILIIDDIELTMVEA